ncbi:hypothetical protein GCM10010967_35830 [Dyadobacter beijingensis]|uniref:Peptidase MA-like domain-containing protein n=1 Tax=Dyadobacter beijingensis TaxID=365489 RepID=A0ABQ2I6R5_9BACT|nr:hypothetical protein [Dyadobacter beijingensis]GGM98775.1 hypothetical protein GCM10010967_35830 [Dyadobacter beijingensis]
MNPLRKVTRFLLTGFIILVGSLFFLFPQVFYCELIAFSNFKSTDKKVYFSPDINPNKYKSLKNTIALAGARVDSFYQGQKSSPKIIICHTPQQYQKYCSSTEGAGCSIGMPWGSAYVVLNAQGMNTDVIAHEMSHIELLERIGWWKTTSDVPQWFNEGLALMLDQRFVRQTDPRERYKSYRYEWRYYTRNGSDLLLLKDISTMRAFFGGDQQHVMTAYMTAGMEVSYWLLLRKNTGLQRFIAQMRDGASFTDAYGPANPHHFKDSKKISE